ncbi:MAG: mechanosensitive ion channel, partial [Muribaculaceae bacterium]|nr:mechanosensitive ion channel [Muribaculaceae bacterium]
SSFIAIFGAAGVAIGMALSGTLQNFAGGVLILLLKPYKVGDYIETQGYAGYVTQIQIFHTIINTYDNKSIIIPNGGLSTGSINNWSREDYRRIDWTVSISYGDSVETAREAILAIFESDDRIVKDYIEDDRILRGITDTSSANSDVEDGDNQVSKRPWWKKILFIRHHPAVREHVARVGEKLTGLNGLQLEKVLRKPSVNLDSLGDSSVNLKARAWARSEFYWSVYYDMNERIYNELPKAGINFPFPQLDVHVSQVKENESVS